MLDTGRDASVKGPWDPSLMDRRVDKKICKISSRYTDRDLNN